MTALAIALIAALLLAPFGRYRLLFCAPILLLPAVIRAYEIEK